MGQAPEAAPPAGQGEGTGITNENAHVRPEPIEAPEPNPTTAEALIRYQAVLHGWHILKGICPGVAFPAFLSAVDAYEFHRDCASLYRQAREDAAHARRRDDPLRSRSGGRF